jgi:hypothetical protein
VSVLAISSVLGCVHAPANKPRAYIAGGAAIVLGGVLAYSMHEHSCNGGSTSGDISCSVGSGIVSVLGLTLAVAGVATIGVTAFAPDAKP